MTRSLAGFVLLSLWVSGCAREAGPAPAASGLKYTSPQAIVARELLSMGQVRARAPGYRQQGRPEGYAALSAADKRRFDLEIVALEALAYPNPVKLDDGSIWYPAGFVPPAGCGTVATMPPGEFERCVLDPGLLDYADADHARRAAEYLEHLTQWSDPEGLGMYQYALTATDCATCNVRQNVYCTVPDPKFNWACNAGGSWSWSNVKLNSGCTWLLQTATTTCGVQTVNQGNPWDDRKKTCVKCDFKSSCDSSGGTKIVTYKPDGSGIASCSATVPPGGWCTCP